MTRFDPPRTRQFSETMPIWDSLIHAIANSSGFQRWQLESIALDTQSEYLSLDLQVQRYLCETLETLAY